MQIIRRLLSQPRSEPEQRLRPPGAKSEGDLRARCIACTRCMEVCPYGSIVMESWPKGPRVRPLRKPCYLCMRCTEVCPTGALSPTDKAEAAMGRASVNEQTCYSYGATVCNLCYQSCPLQGEAIVLDDLLQPVIRDACVGCGVCLHVCPTKPAKSIVLTVRTGA